MPNHFLPTLVFLFAGVFCQAQTATPREFGVRLTGLYSGSAFELIYKKAKSENRYHRFRAGVAQVIYSDAFEEQGTVQVGLFYGLEKRRALAEQVVFLHGLEFGGLLGLGFGDDDPLPSIGLNVGYVLGVQYNPAQPWFLNIETIPGASFTYFDDDFIDFRLGFNSLAALTFGLRF